MKLSTKEIVTLFTAVTLTSCLNKTKLKPSQEIADIEVTTSNGSTITGACDNITQYKNFLTTFPLSFPRNVLAIYLIDTAMDHVAQSIILLNYFVKDLSIY